MDGFRASISITTELPGQLGRWAFSCIAHGPQKQFCFLYISGLAFVVLHWLHMRDETRTMDP